MNYCSNCGGTLHISTPPDDTRERHICLACEAIHYLNPKNVVGTIPMWNDKILLCKRAIRPRQGYWTLPAGFLEINESTQQGAARETYEEAGAEVEIGPLFSLLNVVHAQQVHFFYLAKMKSEQFHAGAESLEVRLFHESEIPWDELAFPTITHTLRNFFADRKSHSFEHSRIPTHHIDIAYDERIDRVK